MICHEKSTLQVFTKPDITSDPLHELIRNGAREVDIPTAVEVELEAMLRNMLKTTLSIAVILRLCNDYFHSKLYQSGVSDVEIKVLKIRDRSDNRIRLQ
ncbi:MAG: hypothetical protein ACTS73_08140 [Arsenophonus sp. NEOnobi-MAG3]